MSFNEGLGCENCVYGGAVRSAKEFKMDVGVTNFLVVLHRDTSRFGMMISLQRSNDGERLDSRWGYVLQPYLNFSVHRCGDEGSTHNRTREAIKSICHDVFVQLSEGYRYRGRLLDLGQLFPCLFAY